MGKINLRHKNGDGSLENPPELEERIAKWERITMRLAGFLAISIILFVALVYCGIEGIKFLIDRFAH
jgi:hypothetical protein